MKMFNNKKILFISGGFYQYDEIISSELKKMGAIVDYFCSAPTTNHTLMRIYQRFIKLREKFCDRLFDKIRDTEYDYVFMLNTARLTDNFVKKISERYIKSKKILYCWDAIKTIPEVENRIKIYYNSDDSYESSIANYIDMIKDETLAVEVIRVSEQLDSIDINDYKVGFRLEKV